MSTHDVDPESELGQWLLHRMLSPSVHDEPYMGLWACGRCPYINAGALCTKCGAPAYEGVFVGGVVVSR